MALEAEEERRGWLARCLSRTGCPTAVTQGEGPPQCQAASRAVLPSLQKHWPNQLFYVLSGLKYFVTATAYGLRPLLLPVFLLYGVFQLFLDSRQTQLCSAIHEHDSLALLSGCYLLFAECLPLVIRFTKFKTVCSGLYPRQFLTGLSSYDSISSVLQQLQ